MRKQNLQGNAGELASIYDQKKNKFLALGLYDPDSPIRIKLLQFQNPAKIDEVWFQSKIEAAYKIRQPLLETKTDSFRFIHGENDGLPGLIVDLYAGVLVVKLYSRIWLPYLKMVVPILMKQSKAQTLVLRLSRSLQRISAQLHGLHDGQVLSGELPEESVIFREYGLRFSANVIKGHKTGFFLDHRDNRRKIGTLSKGKSVLDIFAYAGGFSVHALGGGAREVVSLDISPHALEMAKQNVALNFKKANHTIMAIDAFEGMEQLQKQRKTFDIVIVDPPSFAKRDSERQKAMNTYARLCHLAIGLVAKNGILLMASCSSRIKADEYFELVEKEVSNSGRKYQELEKTLHDIDHPIGFPEGAYLKSVYYRLG
ncbi:MAG: class I SAM-dependent rRNA methyltransferase [Bacteroidetes bacterium]|nr:MAG: class I SAM-dependent rRNA methyltransferase [Bacteroidota bacterium]